MAFPRAAVASVTFSVALACVVFACGGSDFVAGGGEDGGAPPEMDDARVPDAARPVQDAGGPGEAGDSHSAAVVYVSVEGGNDTNTGLSPAEPKKSIAAAVAAAMGLEAGAEVHACAGTYAETQLVLNGAVSLRGGYDCSAWTRTATFGYPTFDHVNDTIVANANPALQNATLVVSGAVPPSTVVDGLTIQGGAILDGVTIGVHFIDEASPVLRDDTITGGGGQQVSGLGSLAVDIDVGSAPEVVADAINGGTGMPESIGVEIHSTGTPHVHQDVVSGGLGNSAIGILVASGASGVDALGGLVVSGCDAPGVSGASSAIQVNAPEAGVDIVSSLVTGCAGVADAGSSSIGIRVASAGTVNVTNDRVFGGSRSGQGAYVVAVQVVSATAATVRNSMLHAGEVTGGSGNGVAIAASGSASIQDDTIYAGAQGGTSVVLQSGAQNVKITNVILLGGGTGQTHAGVFAASCSGILTTLDHDLFVNQAAPIYTCNSLDGGPGESAQTPAQLALLFPTAVDDLDYASAAACSDDAGDCVTSPSCPGTPAACLAALFGPSWSADDGLTALFPSVAPDGGKAPGGWTLLPETPCAIARGGVPVSGVATDLFGNTRNATTPTLGAAEFLGACSP